MWNQGLRRKYMILAIPNNILYIMPYKDKDELWYSSLLVDDMYLHWKTFVQSKYICALQFSFKYHPSNIDIGWKAAWNYENFKTWQNMQRGFLSGPAVKYLCSGNKGNFNFKSDIGSIKLSWIGKQKHITKYTLKGRGESGLMFGAAFDRQNWPDVRPVFGKPSTQIFLKLGSKQW